MNNCTCGVSTSCKCTCNTTHTWPQRVIVFFLNCLIKQMGRQRGETWTGSTLMGKEARQFVRVHIICFVLCSFSAINNLRYSAFTLFMLASSATSVVAVLACLAVFLRGPADGPVFKASTDFASHKYEWQLGGPQSESSSFTDPQCACQCSCPPVISCSFAAAFTRPGWRARLELVLAVVFGGLLWICGAWCVCRHARMAGEQDVGGYPTARLLALERGDGALAARGLVVHRRRSVDGR